MGRIYINNDWMFAEKFKEEHIFGQTSTDMQNIRIPHTTKELPFNYFSEEEYQMLSTYRKVIFAPIDWENKRILLTFEGAAHYAEFFFERRENRRALFGIHRIHPGINKQIKARRG